MDEGRDPAGLERGVVRVALDGRARSLDGVDPCSTVLQWLRGAEQRCGTKEGCAEGDCGACTVVLGELDAGGRVRLLPVNACILPVGALDGRALFTVESLQGPGGALHPVQEALVECHGSQCGFCTPGFVMALWALYESEGEPTRARVDEALQGNLCRCTGYRPIADAAQRAHRLRERAPGAREELAATLHGLRRERGVTFGEGASAFHSPRTLEEAARLLASIPGARPLAGATDLGLWVTKLHRPLAPVVYLGGVDELRRVGRSAGHLELGAAVTYADALGPLEAEHPALGPLVRRIGSPQVRNLATLGGNLANASPVGDGAPALLALGASLVLRRGAELRELPLDDFFRGYRRTALREGELIERVRVPAAWPGLVLQVRKVARRRDQDIASVCGAFALTLDGAGRVEAARLAFGGMAAVPARARNCEAALLGRTWGPAAVETALPALAADFEPLTDVRASARYRRLVAANLLREAALHGGSRGAGAPAPALAGLEGR